MGVEPSQPPQFVVFNVSPTINQINFNIGTLWLNYITQSVYMLVNLEFGIATWILFSGNLHFLTTNSGGPIGPDSANNINVLGDGTTIVGVGNAGAHSITFSTSGTGVVSTLTGNSGGAVPPTAGNINIVGTGPISVTGNPGTSTLTISTSGSGTVESLTTDDGHVVTPTAGTIILAGGNNITTTGTVGPNTATVSVTGTTNHAVQIGNASGSLTSLSVGTNGQLPIGSTGANPVMSTLTAGTGISITNGAGSITIAATNVAGTVNFSARLSADVANATGDGTAYTIICDTVLQNTGAGYNGGTGVFTAPVTGLYCFTCIVDVANLNSNHTVGLVQFGAHSFDSNPWNMCQQSMETAAATSLVYTWVIPLSMGGSIGLAVAITGDGGATKTVTVQGNSGLGNRGCFIGGFLIG